jgi:hypothetical protein
MLTEVIYLNRDNSIDLVLKNDGEIFDLSSVTKIELLVDDVTISSADGHIDFSSFASDGRIIISAGDVEGLSAGTYFADLIVYDADHADGIFWGKVRIVVM